MNDFAIVEVKDGAISAFAFLFGIFELHGLEVGVFPVPDINCDFFVVGRVVLLFCFWSGCGTEEEAFAVFGKGEVGVFADPPVQGYALCSRLGDFFCLIARANGPVIEGVFLLLCVKAVAVGNKCEMETGFVSGDFFVITCAREYGCGVTRAGANGVDAVGCAVFVGCGKNEIRTTFCEGVGDYVVIPRFSTGLEVAENECGAFGFFAFFLFRFFFFHFFSFRLLLRLFFGFWLFFFFFRFGWFFLFFRSTVFFSDFFFQQIGDPSSVFFGQFEGFDARGLKDVSRGKGDDANGVLGRFFGLFLVAFCLFYRVFKGFDEGDDITRVFCESNGFSARYRVRAVIRKAHDAEFGVFFIRADGEKSPLSVVGNIAGARAIP